MINEYTSGPWKIVEVAAEDEHGPALVDLSRDGDVLAVIRRDSIPELLTVLMSYMDIARIELETS